MTFAEKLHHLRQKQYELIDLCRACPDSYHTRIAAEALLTRLHQLADKAPDEQRETVPHFFREWQLLLASVPAWWPLLPWGAAETGRAGPEEHPDVLQLIEATGFVRNIFVQADTPVNDNTTDLVDGGVVAAGWHVWRDDVSLCRDGRARVAVGLLAWIVVRWLARRFPSGQPPTSDG